MKLVCTCKHTEKKKKKADKRDLSVDKTMQRTSAGNARSAPPKKIVAAIALSIVRLSCSAALAPVRTAASCVAWDKNDKHVQCDFRAIAVALDPPISAG